MTFGETTGLDPSHSDITTGSPKFYDFPVAGRCLEEMSCTGKTF